MKIVGVLGSIILVFGLLITLVGLGGAVANFVFPPKELVCEWADRDYEAARKAVAVYEASKGSPSELAKKIEAENALSKSETNSDSCSRARDSHKFYGFIFGGVGVVGAIIGLVGAIAAFLGLRRKKSLA